MPPAKPAPPATKPAPPVAKPAPPKPGTPQRYRFRVRSADGQEVISPVIELLSRDARLKNPRWGDGQKAAVTTHSQNIEMKVDAPGMDGRTVRFNVERLEQSDWVPHTTATGVVKGGVVAAKIQAQHPSGNARAEGKPMTKAALAPVPIRFKVELA